VSGRSYSGAVGLVLMLAAVPLLVAGPIVSVAGDVVNGALAFWTGLMVVTSAWLERRASRRR
jgi:hypothetical protein